jgi:hypothetical protein
MAGLYIPTPHVLRSKGVVNVQNPNDQECFKWSVLNAIHPVAKHTERLSNYSKIDHGLDFSGLEFPLKVSDIPKFERENNIAIHLYGYNKKPYVIQMSLLVNQEVYVKKRTNRGALFTYSIWETRRVTPTIVG